MARQWWRCRPNRPGTVNDAYFRFVVDMGGPGPDRGQGGKYLILPPDYDGPLNGPIGAAENTINGVKYFVAKSPSYSNWVILRGFLVDGKTDAATAMFKNGLKVYPLAQAAKPPAMEFVSGSEKVFNTIHANTYEFYEELHAVMEREPVSMPDAGAARLVCLHRYSEGQALCAGRTHEEDPHRSGCHRQCHRPRTGVSAAIRSLPCLSEQQLELHIRGRQPRVAER